MKQTVSFVDIDVDASFERRGSAARLQEVSYNPGNLRMLYYAPDNMPDGAPLVVLLHGCGQSAESFAVGAGWRDLADRHGFALLCPEQRRSNNFNTCFNWFLADNACRGAGEAASIAQMTRHVIESGALDGERVFIAGLSAGAAMTMVMLAAYPELYAGGAVVAGLAYASARSISEALVAMRRGTMRAPDILADAVREAAVYDGRRASLSVWHGDLDTTVAPANAGAIVRQWADVGRISAAPPKVEQLGPRHRTRWCDGSGDVVLELNMIAGLNHAWGFATAGVDGCGSPGPFFTETGISTSAEILRFWRIHDEHCHTRSRLPIVSRQTQVAKSGIARVSPEPKLPDARRLVSSKAGDPSGSAKPIAVAAPKRRRKSWFGGLIGRLFHLRKKLR